MKLFWTIFIGECVTTGLVYLADSRFQRIEPQEFHIGLDDNTMH